MIRLIIMMVPLLLLPVSSVSQDETISEDEKREVVDSIAAILESTYVFPDVGEEMSDFLRSNLGEGTYDPVSDPSELASKLTEDIRSISHDLHLRVGFQPDMIKEMRSSTPEDSIAYVERRKKEGRRENYGFSEIKILDGNIGYLNLTGFHGVNEESGKTAEAAMNLLGYADAIIIDLRTNGGGSPQMIQLITSYLFGDRPVHLNNFYNRNTDDTTQTWTLPYVPGKRNPDAPVYVLTSSRTFSAAEEFSYNLRNLERATLIGETTGGGAHPGGTVIATDRFTVWVPDGRAINPITWTNWEGTGVKPHIEVEASKAFDVARQEALKALMKEADEEDKFQLEWALTALEAEDENYSMSEMEMKACEGIYGPRKITCRDGKLYYQRDDNPQHELIPLSDELFLVDGIPYFRIKLIREGEQVAGLYGLYQDGRTDKNLRTD